MTGIYWHIKLLLVNSLRSCWSAGLAKKERDKNLDFHILRWRQDFDFVFHAAAINKSRSQRSQRSKSQDRLPQMSKTSSSDDWTWRKWHWRQGVHGTVLSFFESVIIGKTSGKRNFSRPQTNNSGITHTSWDKSLVTCIQIFTNHVSFYVTFTRHEQILPLSCVTHKPLATL